MSSGVTTAEDVHLILEYKSDAHWGDMRAPRANRFIVRNDEYNPIINSLNTFTDSFDTFQPRLFALSGLHVMDNEPLKAAFRTEKLNSLTHQLRRLSGQTLVHFEMASFVEPEYLKEVLHSVVPHSDSLGMNEQELQNLEQILEHNRHSLVADHNPPVSKTLSQVRQLFQNIRRDYSRGSRRLSRIHIHTLAYQLIMVVRGTEWKNTRNAAAKAALTAHRYVCGTDFVNPESASLLLDGQFHVEDVSGGQSRTVPVTEKNAVPCWEENIPLEGYNFIPVEVCIAPVLVCRVAKWTTGAGDNISAAGLVLQI